MDTLESLIERARKAEDQMRLPLASLLRYMAPDDLHAARHRIADYVLAHADALIARERAEAQRIADYALAQADALVARERAEAERTESEAAPK